MPTTLTNGIQLPDKGSVDWYNSMQSNYNLIDTHLGDTDTHVTAEDKANWNSKQGSLSQAQLDAIAQVSTNTSDIATLQSGKANASHTHSSSDITDIGDYATKQYVDNSISGLVDNAPAALDTLKELSTALNDDANFASTVTTALSAKADSADLATVATSGSYTDLDDKPTIPTNTSDLTNDSDFVVSSNLATIATSGDYDDLSNKPSIPTKTSDLTNDSNFVDTSNSAVASGITSAKVTSYDSHVADTDIHVTTADKTKWNNGVSQAYVFRYSGTAVVPNSTIAYSTIDNTDNIKSGDKILDLDGKLFEITAVDTTNQTVTVGTALIDLALDANVVHTSGNETVGGVKTFTGNISLKSLTAEYTVTGAGISVTYSDKNGLLLANNKLGNYQNGIAYNKFSIYAYDSNNQLIDRTLTYSSSSGTLATAFFRPDNDNIVSLGTSGNRWSKVYATNYYYGNDNVEFSTKFVTTDTAQTVSGAKTFSDNLTIYNSDDTQTPKGLTIRNAQWGMGESGGTTTSSIKFLDKNSNIPVSVIASKGSSGQSFLRFSLRTKDSQNNSLTEEIYYDIDTSGNVEFRPWHDNIISLGTSAYKWKDVQTKLINGLTPSSLGMPSDRSARIDISGYITNLGNGDNNSYTVPANGYIWLHFTSINSAVCLSQTSGGLTNYAQVFVRYSGDGLLYAFFPVRNGDNFVVQIYTSSTAVVQNAYFIPCQGNV